MPTAWPGRCPVAGSEAVATPEHEARPHRRVDHLVAQRIARQIVKAVARAVRRDEPVGVHLAESRDGLAAIVVAERRHDMEAADDGVHLVDAGDRLSLLHRVDDAAVAARGQHDEPLALHHVCGRDLVVEIVRDIIADVLCRRHLFREAAEAVEDADDLLRRPQRLFERGFGNPAGGEGVVGDQRRAFRHHQREVGAEDRPPFERTENCRQHPADAEGVLAADEQRHLAPELPLFAVRKPTMPPK